MNGFFSHDRRLRRVRSIPRPTVGAESPRHAIGRQFTAGNPVDASFPRFENSRNVELSLKRVENSVSRTLNPFGDLRTGVELLNVEPPCTRNRYTGGRLG
jgi:hypothetical protein